MEEDKKIKFTERISHAFRKKWLLSGFKLFLVIAVLVVAYYCIYLWTETNDLPEYDLTTNKIHTLSDSSKEVISKIDKEISISVFGFDEEASVFDLLKQYNKANELITYRSVTKENDLAFVTEHKLEDGYAAIIIECDGSEKLIDYSELYTFDYTISQNVDITEEKITNSILSMVEENKPKIYFLAGHQEYTDNELSTIKYLLKNESFEYSALNLGLQQQIPDDCNIIAIIGPQKDLSDAEATLLKEYIQKGGNIFVSVGVLSDENKNLSNLNSVLELYGVEIENGFIFEYNEDMLPNKNYPFMFIPTVSSTNKITSSIYTDSYIVLLEAGRINVQDNNYLQSLNVKADILLKSSDESAFINDFSESSLSNAELSAEPGSSNISGAFEKTVNYNGEEKKSKLVIVTSTAFLTDLYSQYVSSEYPLSYIGSNKDFVINSMAYLGDKNYTLTIRKDYAANTYKPTEQQNRIVLTIIFSVPLFILAAGAIIWNYRNKRK